MIGKHNLRLRAQAYDGIDALTKTYNFTVIGTPGMRSGDLVSPILAFSLPPPWTSATFAGAMYVNVIVIQIAATFLFHIVVLTMN